MAPLWLLAVLVLLAESYFAGAVVIPLLISFFLALLLDPVVAWGQRRGIPRPWAACLVVIGFFFAAAAAGWTFSRPFSRIMADLPKYASRIKLATSAVERQTRKMQKSAESVEGAVPEANPEVPKVQVVAGDESWTFFMWRGVSSVFQITGIAVFIPFLIAFALIEKDLLLQALEALMGVAFDTSLIAAETSRMTRAYFFGNLAVGLCLSLLHWFVFAGLGLENAVGLGLLTGFITIIPIIGLPVAVLLPAAQGLLQFQRPMPFVVLTACLVALHVLTSGLVIPRLIGARVKLNTTAATASLLFWGWLWGIAGFLLAVPLTALIKILLESGAQTRPLSKLLAGKPRDFTAWIGTPRPDDS
jgi:predicted PurR-regulated permease PerM